MLSKIKILTKFVELKKSSKNFVLNFNSELGGQCSLVLIGKNILESKSIPEVALIAKWRSENSHAFPSQFKVTIEDTKTWCDRGLINNPERILFWVIDSAEKKIGHVGLFRISNDGSHIEADNIIRGEVSVTDKKIMLQSLKCLLQWQRDYLQIPESYLRVLSDNNSAINLYKNLGYTEIKRVPLKKVITPDRISWEEITEVSDEKAEKYFLTMYQGNM